jgi:hypothetical protein
MPSMFGELVPVQSMTLLVFRIGMSRVPLTVEAPFSTIGGAFVKSSCCMQ